ncbi:histidine kinase [Spirillospora sp. NPDC047279]|uniref:sensor histidine kinase n=1 Tax=Spirillospora sp. NPDC047279 TaxID=3155478 RepID=UPI0033E28BB7
MRRADRWAAAALVAAAVTEAVIRSDGSLALVLLLAAATTVPLFLHGGWRTALTVTVAAVLLSAAYRSPSVAGALATAAAWLPVIQRHRSTNRAVAAARDADRRAFEASLVELTARGERARIARELHDVVAHHISMISVQADTARLAVPGMPPDGVKHLVAIGETARTALTEMRRLLGVLREDAEDAEDADTAVSRRPQPGLRDLLELIDEARASGVGPARLIISGPVAPLDSGIELTAYRIVQEALTNARRHAPGAAVDVEVAYAADGLRLRIRDNGPGPPPGHRPAGHGLLGMRERAATVGGTLRTGPTSPTGFLVEAVLPTGVAS